VYNTPLSRGFSDENRANFALPGMKSDLNLTKTRRKLVPDVEKRLFQVQLTKPRRKLVPDDEKPSKNLFSSLLAKGDPNFDEKTPVNDL